MAVKTATKAKQETAGGLKRVRVTIRGLPPGLIFQGKGVMAAAVAESGKKKKPRSAEEEARLRAHWKDSGAKRELCVPWVMLYRSICSAAGAFKFRGQKTMATVVAGTIACEEDRIGLGIDAYEVFEEYVRIPPRTGSMVLIGRPRLREWEATFVMLVDDEMYAAASLRDIIAHAGKLVGIGAWRPELKGPYGKFAIIEFAIL